MSQRFGHHLPGRLTWRAPDPADAPFLAALYLATRPDLGALPVPRSVIEGIARHQQQLQRDDYARRYPAAETWLLLEADAPVGRLVMDRGSAAWRVVDLAVAAGARRQGVARRVLAALQADCTGELRLRVRRANLAARALYAQCGFTAMVGDGDGDDGEALELRWRQNE